MRVRITYGIDLDDIPSVITSELRECIEGLYEQTAKLQQSIDRLETLMDLPPVVYGTAAIELEAELEEYSVLLSKTENKMADMKAILSGFSGAVMPPPASVAAENPTHSNEESSLPDDNNA